MASLNEALSIIWSTDVWMTKQQASRAGNLGLYFLRAYLRLGELAMQERLPRYPIFPKHHMLYHCFFYLASSASQFDNVYNVVCEACSQDEDFIGKVSRVSRRSGTRAIIKGAIRRYLVCCGTVWHHELY